MKFNGWRKLIPQISTSLLCKLTLSPILILIVDLIFGIKGDIAKISIFEAAMPTVLTASVFAEQFRLNTKLVNLIIGISIIVCFLTTSIWFQIIEFLF